MMTPTHDSPTFTFRVENSVGALAGNTSSHRICQRLAPRDRMRRIFSTSVERKPWYMFRMVTISEMARVMTMMAPGPAPIQTMNMGPRAVLGRALSTTR